MRSHSYPPSPVPGDTDLWPGELPFTAFGQWGKDHLDLRVFEQDIWWVDRHGQEHEIIRMDARYVRNVIGHLTVNAQYFHLEMLLKGAIEILGDTLLGRASGECLAAQVGAPTPAEMTAEGWLESTPLMRRLRALETHSRQPV